jgi:hypothetical protein
MEGGRGRALSHQLIDELTFGSAIPQLVKLSIVVCFDPLKTGPVASITRSRR